MSAGQAEPGTNRRWWLLLLVLLIAGGIIVGGVIGGGKIAHRNTLEPDSQTHSDTQLQPASRYELRAIGIDNPLFFSAKGMGYPAVVAEQVRVGDRLQPRYRVLDDLCHPLNLVAISGSVPNISPTRELFSWTDASDSGMSFHFYRRYGLQAQVPCPTDGVNSPGPWPCSDGVFGYDDDRVWLYTPDGGSLSASLARGQVLALGVASADERFIPLTDRKQLLLYDTTAKKIVLATPFPEGQIAMIWRQNDRLLLTPRSGKALVFDGMKQTASIAPGADGWRWGEDGTVWTLSGGRLRVLRWRAGAPELVAIPTRGTPGTRYGSLAPGIVAEPPFRKNTDPDWAAVCDDGQLVASEIGRAHV